MLASITDDHWIYIDQITPQEEDILIKEFSVKHPRANYIDTTTGCFDGWYRKYSSKFKRMARPLLGELRAVCNKHGLPLNVVDQRPPPKYPSPDPSSVTSDLLPGIVLEEYQMEALRIMCKAEVGCISAPTGSGKGECIAAITKLINCPTVIIAEAIVVIEQLKERLELREVVEEAGLFCSGKRPNGHRVIVGSIQSLNAPAKAPIRTKKDTAETYARKAKSHHTRLRNAQMLRGLVAECDMLIIDECVHEDTFITTDMGIMPAKVLFDELNANKNINAIVGGSLYKISGKKEKIDESVCVRTSRGRELVCSKNHKIATFDGGIRADKYAKDLSVGDVLLVADYAPEESIEIDKRWYHLGLFIGDGHLLNGKQVKFSVRKDCDDWEREVGNIIKEWGGTWSMTINKRGDYVFRCKSEKFIEWLHDLGFKKGRKMGRMKMDFIVPNRAAAAGLLRGLFDTEGSSYPSSAKFDSTDESLIRLSQVLCSYLGIHSTIITTLRSGTHSNSWRLAINSHAYRRFMKIVGFGFNRKIKPICHGNQRHNNCVNPEPFINKWLESGIVLRYLLEYLGCPGHDTYSSFVSPKTILQWFNKIQNINSDNIVSYDAAKMLGISDAIIAKKHGISTMTAYNWRVHKNWDGWRACIGGVLNRLKSAMSVDSIMEYYDAERVVSVNDAGKCRLIDFSVEGVHSFESNSMLVHNCDRSSAANYKNLFKFWFKGRRRFGFSGTVYDIDKPVENLVLKENMGSIISSIDRKSVEAAGRIIPVSYNMLSFGSEGSKKDKSAFDIATKEWMVENPKFHELIKKLAIKTTSQPGYGVLILIENLELGYKLEEMIPGSRFICGAHKTTERNEVIKAFESRENPILIGSKILARGLDLKGGCESLIIATGGKLTSSLIQKVGRALRKNKAGKAVIYDFLFYCNYYLYSHSRNRLKTLVSMEYPTKVIFKGGSIDGEQFVKSRFRVPKGYL